MLFVAAMASRDEDGQNYEEGGEYDAAEVRISASALRLPARFNAGAPRARSDPFVLSIWLVSSFAALLKPPLTTFAHF